MTYKERFNDILMLRELQPNTINTYNIIFDSFMRYSDFIKTIPEEISTEQIISYLSKIKSPSTRRQAIGVCINLYQFVLRQGFKLHGLPYPKRHRTLPDYLTPFELKKVFDSVKNKKQLAIIKLQYACGLRVEEVCNVKRADFIKKWDGNTGKFVHDLKIHGKGANERVVPVPDETVTEIHNYWRSLPAKEKHPEYLFKGQFRSAYSTRTVQIVMKRAMLKNGIEKYGSTHLLRKSRASHLVQSGVEIAFIQRLLGHKNINTTIQSYAGFKTNDMRVVFNRADVFLKESVKVKFEQKQIAC